MGFFSQFKAYRLGAKAYSRHTTGLNLRTKGNYAESEAKLNEAIKLYDEAYAAGFRKSAAMQGYALLLMRQGDFARAREIMLESSKDKSLSPESRFALRIDYSICQWKMGSLDKAIETIKLAAEYKKNSTVYNMMGLYLIERSRQTGDFEEAIQINNEAFDYDSEDPAALDNMGQLYLALSEKTAQDGDKVLAGEQRAKAKEYLAQAFEAKPEQVSSSYFYAKMLYEDGNVEKAREVLEKTAHIPVSCIWQVSKEEIEALRKTIG